MRFANLIGSFATRKLALAAFLVSACAAIAAADMTVYFVDVGQGDAIYIELPSGKKALIDGGPKSKSIADFLNAHNVKKLDYVVLTHPHSDHYRGLKYVFTHYEVGNYYDTRMENPDAKGDNTLRELSAAEPGCTSFFPAPGDILDWDPEVKIRVLNSCPSASSSSNNDVVNNCSIVLRMTYKTTSFLFMGDAESPIENAMMRIFRTGLASQVLKVGHHGSRYSSGSDFLAKVKPQQAYIQVGAGNVYGHPHQEALDRLKAAGAQIYRTDLSGTLKVTIPGNKSIAETSIYTEEAVPSFSGTDTTLSEDQSTKMEEAAKRAKAVELKSEKALRNASGAAQSLSAQ